MDTLTGAIDRFKERGYRADFHTKEGKITCDSCPIPHEPDALVIDDFRRFEGATDPGDESAVFALSCREHGEKGTLVVSYGPAADPEDMDAIQRLGKPH